MTARLCLLLLAGSLAGCGSQWTRVGKEPARETPEEALADVFNPAIAYEEMGRLAAPEPLPFIGHLAFADGPADSVIAILALALENRALTFQREGDGFVGRYRVEIRLQQEGDPPIALSLDETVRVASFEETLRDDESIIFQQSFHLIPGTYAVAVAVSDMASPDQSRAEGTYQVPRFTAGTTSDPMIAYQVTGRESPRQPLSILLNPRGSVAYGVDTLLAYIEGYGFLEPTIVPFVVRNELGETVYRDSLLFQGVHPVESHIVRLTPERQPLGGLTVSVGDSANQRTTAALVAFSDGWVLKHYEEVINLLRYFDEDVWLDSLRRTPEEKRADVWLEFKHDTDPNKATPENEALDVYFTRVQAANRMFRNEGIPGWRTHRGEVYITLGSPDDLYDRRTEAEGRFIYWSYTDYRTSLIFEDLAGFGLYRLTPESRAVYSNLLARLQRQRSG